ncbi:MAG: MBL fold metallo-hydrolase [Acholeplasmataceae bacterium]
MQIQKYVLGDIKSNCYIVFNETNAFVVDPGYENNHVESFLNEHNLKLDFIYLTHGHFDHVGGVKQLKELYHTKVYAPKKDLFWLTTFALQHFSYEIPVDQYFEEPFEFKWQDLTLRFFDTPGHSEGGSVLWIKELNVLFSGDTLFFQTIGRTDIPYSNYEDIVKSVKKLYLLFPDITKVYPGHGRSTSIGYEKNNNLFIKN